MQRLTGIAVSPGVVFGRAVLLKQRPLVVRFLISSERVEHEIARLEEARDLSRRQLHEIKARVARGIGADLAYLFDAQLLMLDDPMLVARAAELVRTDRVNAEWAVQQAYEALAGIFDDVEDEYLRDRKGDVADVVGRLRMNLHPGGAGARELFRDLEEPAILVADELTPSIAAQLDWTKIRGLASDAGSRTYHTAILARSLRVPAVVGLSEASARVSPGTTVLIDGTTGELLIDPPAGLLEEASARQRDRTAGVPTTSLEVPGAPAVTLDGATVRLQANIELPEDVALAREYGAEGIGLYRSEFALSALPSAATAEDAQYEIYRRVLQQMAPAPVTVRTFDLDDETDNAEEEPERWGSGRRARSRGRLGLRAIGIAGAGRRELLRLQLRALARAARHGRLRIMFPFVSGVEEVREARRLLAEVIREFGPANGPAEIPVGVLIELPSAALTADLLAREVDFFSIGTNDLIQYCLAVDREDPRMARFYEPLHPAILRGIRLIQRAATRQGIPVSLCGEIASDPVLLRVLVGLGLRDFSMSPTALPMARRVVRELHADEMRRLAGRLLRLATVEEIERALAGPAEAAGRPAGGHREQSFNEGVDRGR